MMDNNTLQALTTLAEKLGTTSEYLWGALLRQAPIAGTIKLVVMAMWVAAAVFLIRLVRRKTMIPPKTDDDRHPLWKEFAGIAWGLSIVLAICVALQVSLSLSNTVAALFNPEYWALNQILKMRN